LGFDWVARAPGPEVLNLSLVESSLSTVSASLPREASGAGGKLCGARGSVNPASPRDHRTGR